ncbi:MAG: TIGR01244 family phosphatase [Betaproteobacteria bacterium]|jgi:sulfide:quinone oxidoreductase|nr:TIGR01244 family phosphatase [Betaproteobacteria bacterium]NBP45502.1 TIGR01244 family phosphatase [Betaproteobacteria bacterium]
MDLKKINDALSVAAQIQLHEVSLVAQAGFKSVICNRPDGESPDQPSHQEIQAACAAHGMAFRFLPADTGKVLDGHGTEFGELLRTLPGPVLAYCRTGTRSTTMWALSQANVLSPTDIIDRAAKAGFDMRGLIRRLLNGGLTPNDTVDAEHDVVIVGGGAAGIAVAASLLSRDPNVDIAIIEPAEVHYYQPGWTLVSAGVFQAQDTARSMASVLPAGVRWIKSAVAAFEPQSNRLVLEGCRLVQYKQLIVAAGLKLDWNAIPGLAQTLGQHGVTSNYRFDLAPYTWQLVQGLQRGTALFTQPLPPFKCAGAAQKAMYLAADHWRSKGVLQQMDIHYCSAAGVLFHVPDYVPALMSYIQAYGIDLRLQERLVAVNGPAQEATFATVDAQGQAQTITRRFDLLHVVPPQTAPDFVRHSPLADAAGWVDVDAQTLQHKVYANVHALGDVGNSPNSKTAAAARAQAPVVAHNVMVALGRSKGKAKYNGYGSCPFTVERGKVVLAEFLYEGKLAPTFPTWLINGKKPSRLAWLLKERLLPPVYWSAMLKGREWLVNPELEG